MEDMRVVRPTIQRVFNTLIQPNCRLDGQSLLALAVCSGNCCWSDYTLSADVWMNLLQEAAGAEYRVSLLTEPRYMPEQLAKWQQLNRTLLIAKVEPCLPVTMDKPIILALAREFPLKSGYFHTWNEPCTQNEGALLNPW